MDMRVRANAGCIGAGSDVCAVIDMNTPIGAKFSCLTRAIQVKTRDAFGRKRIAEDGVEDLHIQLAGRLGPPAWMSKVFERAGEFHGVVLGRKTFDLRL